LISADGSASHLSGVDRLTNTFSIMRHGQSKANVAGIIVSRIENDLRGDYGLSELGRAQALEAVQARGLSSGTVIFSSDFSRARQTAEIVGAHLGAPEVNLATALRERCFGNWEGSSTDNYARVWAADETDSDQVGSGVEPVAAVLDRTTALIVDLERRYSGRSILLVSHGDTLQILQAGFLRVSPTRHRRLPPLGTAEIRPLRLEERAASPRLAGLIRGLHAGQHARPVAAAVDQAVRHKATASVSRARGPRGRPGPRRCRGRASPRPARGSSPPP